jgi:PTH2 family peptidyl-tRNA hydrolase
MTERPAKQVIVMRKDLNMRKGKMIAQGAHAALQVFLERGAPTDGGYAFTTTDAMAEWLRGRVSKICVSVDSEAALDEVIAKARAAKVPCA